MAQTTFSGPVKSLRGFVTAGPDKNTLTIGAETTLTVATHAGKLLYQMMQVEQFDFQQSKH